MKSNKDNEQLTDNEKSIIKALNYVATFDGVIQTQDEIKYILKLSIEKLIPKKRRHLLSISENAYPVKIKY